MLSNLIISTQRFVFVIDELGHEKISEKFICQLLREQGQDESTTRILPVNEELKREATFAEFSNFCANSKEHKWNVLLPPFSDLICFQRPAVVFQFLDKLSKCGQVQRVFLWASRCHLMHPQAVYLVSACEYMADLVLHLETPTELSIVTRKPGGGVTNKRYTCKRSKKEFLVEPVKSTRKSPEQGSTEAKPEQLGTFKIELDEDELVARNALKLPYEKTSEAPEGNIIYSPDAEDDFDDEDPDEDLCI